ncbi:MULTISPECIES: winged helix-turn-helix domain-containing protein [unclassified Bacteroides]|jgi:hypothetical protein|uniref:winged helix-turn-helix domain-containing protein n=1 Tax=unclassified Bacteroides TaxID=2646097 RepID=UPI000E842B2D|nr:MULTISPECIES: winged helix-turn-helix domain-containing protein [unclassified Bacteroides]RGN48615.1 hypothetical protein DXB63_07540 [Bacteroides sp. OM05-12]RHR75577.1 hypothetical protein DWW69_09840 [Bacteroides sp. AF16-49]
MNKATIGYNAGILWNLLSNNLRWSYKELQKSSGLNDIDLNMAVGWLAREDKIEFEEEDEGLFLFLNVNVYIG